MVTMLFEMKNLRDERGIRITEADDSYDVIFSAGFLDSHAGYAYLTPLEALAVAGALRAMAERLIQENQDDTDD